jgi:zinc transport system substrate-binding protein
MRLKTFILTGLFMWLCSGLLVVPVRADSVLNVAVSIVPQKYFVEKVGGEFVDVVVMVPPGASPERYEPKPRQMVALSQAKIYFSCGIEFEEAWLDKIAASNPGMRVVHTEEGIEKRWMEGHDHVEGGPGSVSEREESHGHWIKDPHIWLSPPLVMVQARNVLNALLDADSAHRDSYETNYAGFIKELVDLDLAIKNVFWGRGRNLSFMVLHPAWGYFAEAYGLKQIPVEVEGKEPKAQDLQRLIVEAKKQGIKVIFVQPQFSTTAAQTIANAIGGRTLFADPLAGDWAKNLRDVAAAVAAVTK